MIKVFRLNDCDWWAGENLESVKKDYLKETGLDAEEAFDDPEEITEEIMNKGKYVDEDGKNERTFKEELDSMIKNGTKFPAFFASSEY